MALGWFISLTWFSGCASPEVECRATIDAWADEDGDGYGEAPLGKVCALEEGQADRPLDCDDGDPQVHPEAHERCNGVDDDCDGEIDDGKNTKQWWTDADGDGFGGAFPSQLGCQSPGDGWVDNSDDCDDDDATVFPGSGERCGGSDEDCDGFVDDADDDVDPATETTFYRDADGDGAGDRRVTTLSCQEPPGWVDNTADCDDADPTFAFAYFFADADGDGYGDPNTAVPGCQVSPGKVDNGDDCDDTDPRVHAVADWLHDRDGDGYGSGAPVVTQCAPPGGGLVSSVLGLDCDETAPAIHPGAHDICEDGVDQDCNGTDPQCGPIGSFDVGSGPSWGTDPPVYSCIEACALLFGGSSSDYDCSTLSTTDNQLSFVSGWGDGTYCAVGIAQDFKLEPPGNPGYNCGAVGCAYSAYVQDWCFGSINYCWRR